MDTPPPLFFIAQSTTCRGSLWLAEMFSLLVRCIINLLEIIAIHGTESFDINNTNAFKQFVDTSNGKTPYQSGMTFISTGGRFT